MELLKEFVNITALGICLGIGYIIKNSLGFINNKYIPLIMGILGIILVTWITGVITPDTVLSGLASGLGATGAYELQRNLKG